jgi:D-alanyl-lipoteichoic acid acyltransferase DltB (MBOAT superfamily)
MSFSGVELAFFLPVALIVYWLLPRRASWQNAFLLLVSYVFYASWGPRLVPLLLVATAVDYSVAVYLDTHKDAGARRRVALALSVVFNLGVLGFFKYAGFFAASIDRVLSSVGLGAPLPVLHILLPLGISFYTFQKLGYVIDVYYERIPACRSPLEFATFVAFFPQLIAGPIVRGGDLLPQYAQPRALDPDKLRAGAGTFFVGFFKKAYLADLLGRYFVDPVFSSHETFSRAGHWVGLVAYAFQIYCDFSGYSEMAIGTARLFGIELPANFNYPFLSKGMIEFWRRWHITLNTWLFDYIYGPLTTGEGFMRGRLELGFLVVFLASGLWHGAKMTFLAWGLAHGVALVVQHRWDLFYKGLCRKDRKWVARRKSAGYGAVAWALTQLWFLVTLVPFRAPSLGETGEFLRRLVVPSTGALLPSKSPDMRPLNMLVCVAFMIGYHLLELPRFQSLRSRFFALPAVVRGVAYGAVVVFLLMFVPISAGTFIYAQF